MKKATNWIKNHRLFTVIILFLFIIAVILCFHFSATYVNLSKVSRIHISISNYNLNAPNKLVLEIDTPEQFDETQQFIRSVQKLSGANPFRNGAIWDMKINYTYKNGKTKFRIISGDRNFEELTGIIQKFQSELQ